MDKRKNNNTDSWDEGVYGTGNTMPPKSNSGIIALLLMMVIFLSGIISALGFLNIKLFQELNAKNEQAENSPISFSNLEETSPPTEAADHRPEFLPETDLSLRLNQSPQSVENIPQEGGLSLQEIYTKNISSVVSISSSTRSGILTGSGVILSAEGYIITSYQAIQDAETITIRLSDQRTLSALLVGADKLTDLAVLYVDAPDLIPAEFGDSMSLRVGDAVATIGDPLGSMTNGIVSAINRNVILNGQQMEFIQTNAALNQENSGGPLINCYGQVIGINTLKSDSAAEGVGYAIPSSFVKQIVDQLLAQGYVSGRPTLGLEGEALTVFEQQYFHIPPGLYLTKVELDSHAAAMGVEPGDILTTLDGCPVQSSGDLDDILFRHSVGDSLEAVIYRGGKQFTLILTLSEATN